MDRYHRCLGCLYPPCAITTGRAFFPGMERSSGIRKFSEMELERLRMIECLKTSGLELKDIKQYMDWCVEGSSTLLQCKELFDKQLPSIGDIQKRISKE